MWGACLLITTLVAHRTPLYGVETDLVREYLPAAHNLRAGTIQPEHYILHGLGYPGLLAAGLLLTGNDGYLAARLLNVSAAVAAGACAFLLVRGFLGGVTALATLFALLANPIFVRAAVEAGTDMPALALSLASTVLVLTPRRTAGDALAGFLAGFAAITRYNTIFLVPAAALVFLPRPDRWQRLAAYAVGLAIPVSTWLLPPFRAAANPLHNLYYLNLAYEVYGGGMGLDRFGVETGARYGSFFDVFRFDPSRFVLHVGRNIATRWLTDTTQLMPVWIGALALPGMLVVWRRRAGWPAMGIHFLLSYSVLCLALYSARFFLYLLPFYLSGALGLLIPPQSSKSSPARTNDARPVAPRSRGATRARGESGWLAWWRRTRGASNTAGKRRAWLGGVGMIAAGGLVAASAVQAVRETTVLLRDPPEETRIGGEMLRRIGRPGQSVMARKPHVAYFARMGYVPLSDVDTFTDFLAAAAHSHAEYLFISPIECALQPQLSVLVDSAVTLPGLEPLGFHVLGETRYFALYRIVPNDAPLTVVEDSLLGAIRRFAARRPGQSWPQTYLGGQLVTMERYREALAPLAEAERFDPSDPLVARFQAIAYSELGEYDAAAAACERGIHLVTDDARQRAYLGHIRLAQGRYEEARAELRRAIGAAPANAEYLTEYLRASAFAGDWRDVAATAGQILRADAADATARLFGARAWLALGRAEHAWTIVDLPGGGAGPDSVAYAAFADSLRRAVIGPADSRRR